MPKQANLLTSTTATPSILSATGTVLPANANRYFFSIQNVGTNPIFIKFGSGASSTVFHAVIKGGSGNSDGLGGSYTSADVCYTGDISIAGTSPLYVLTEM